MTLLEAMERRHSVRSYTDQPICGEVLASLEREVRACNIEGGLHIQLVTENSATSKTIWPWSGPVDHPWRSGRATTGNGWS